MMSYLLPPDPRPTVTRIVDDLAFGKVKKQMGIPTTDTICLIVGTAKAGTSGPRNVKHHL